MSLNQTVRLVRPGKNGYAPMGYRVAFGIMLALQIVTAIWYWLAGRLIKKQLAMKQFLSSTHRLG